MIAKCAICGFDGHVHDYEAWQRYDKWPKIWICDVCAADIR